MTLNTQSADEENAVKSLLSSVNDVLPVLKRAEEKLNKDFAHRFSVAALFDPDENTSSRILADLLDPQGSHGQGDIFLQSFMDYFIPAWKDFFKESRIDWVNIEYSTDKNRRVDIILKAKDYWIGIENKFRAAVEQKEQANDYLKFLKNKAGDDKDKFRLIYLSQDGAVEPNCTENREQLIFASWVPPKNSDKDKNNTIPYILKWLDQCCTEQVPEKVNRFLRDFRDFVRNDLTRKSEEDMTQKEVLEIALKDENLKAALLVTSASDAIHNKIKRDAVEELKRLLETNKDKDDEWEIIVEKSDFLLHKKNWANFFVGIGIDSNSFGIKAPKESAWLKNNKANDGKRFIPDDKIQILREEAQVDEEISYFRKNKSDWWPIYYEILKGQEADAWYAIRNMKKDGEVYRAFYKMVQAIDKVLGSNT